MRAAAVKGHSTATDLADYLVQKGLPFRDAHEVVGNLVSRAIELGMELTDLSIQELQQQSSLITDDVFEVLSLEGSVNARNHPGGTARSRYKRQLPKPAGNWGQSNYSDPNL